ncbi:pilus assembly protein PilP [Silvimonas amylolytica]|uniref:Pilus biosynthesis protein PilP n=1 Tax=Silvimonas amylolytica TaxID=449663 RepID=A0ABQ2PQF0_9NEIS|nr:pilus assembly protein PilP [Silvimonas amylolytica]GGP27853.1 pilus biosynthesis protein PilP [Silvimonas amylolytica]
MSIPRMEHQHKRMMLRGLAVSMVALLLAGCFGDENSDLKAWMRERSEGMRGHIEPLPEARQYTPFAYNAFDVADPFNPHKMDAARKNNSAMAPDTNRPKEALENYDLEKLTFVGTLQQAKTIQALIRAPDGNLYRVKVGNYMGQNFGKIMAITDAEVKLKEIVEDSGGDWVERDTSLPLQEAELKK